MKTAYQTIAEYNTAQTAGDKQICLHLKYEIDEALSDAESKLWHGHPVWFLAGNPIVGYSKEKRGIRLMFWSGKDFDEESLNVRGDKFKDASKFYNDVSEVNEADLKRWLKKAEKIQWDYKNIVKRKGVLERLK
jgi:hypothetical protein